MPGRRQLIFYIIFCNSFVPRVPYSVPGFLLVYNIWQPGVQPMSYTHIFQGLTPSFVETGSVLRSLRIRSLVQRIFLVSSLQKPFPPACPNNGRLLFNYKFDNPTDGREREWVSPAFCPCEFSILSALGNTSILKVSIMVSILAELDWGEGLVFTKLGQG